jgi:hypothetical protein
MMLKRAAGFNAVKNMSLSPENRLPPADLADGQSNWPILAMLSVLVGAGAGLLAVLFARRGSCDDFRRKHPVAASPM